MKTSCTIGNTNTRKPDYKVRPCLALLFPIMNSKYKEMSTHYKVVMKTMDVLLLHDLLLPSIMLQYPTLNVFLSDM